MDNEMTLFSSGELLIASYPNERKAVVYPANTWRSGVTVEWDVINGNAGITVAVDDNDVFENIQVMIDLANIRMENNSLTADFGIRVLVEAMINGVTPANKFVVNQALPEPLRPLLNAARNGKFCLTITEDGQLGLRHDIDKERALRFTIADALPVLTLWAGKNWTKYKLPADLSNAGDLEDLVNVLDDKDFEQKLMAWATGKALQAVTRGGMPAVAEPPAMRVIGISGAPALPLVASLVTRENDAVTLMLGDQAYMLSHKHVPLPSLAQVSDALHDAGVVTALLGNTETTASNGVMFSPVLPGTWTMENQVTAGSALRALTDHITTECREHPQRVVLHADLHINGDCEWAVNGHRVENPALLPAAVIPAGTPVDTLVLDNNGAPRLLSFTINDEDLTISSPSGRRDWAEAIHSER